MVTKKKKEALEGITQKPLSIREQKQVEAIKEMQRIISSVPKSKRPPHPTR
jgi:hypothetical protein